MVRSGYRSATVAVIETTHEEFGPSGSVGETVSLQLAPSGVSVRGAGGSGQRSGNASGAEDEDEDQGERAQNRSPVDDDEDAVGITARQKSMLGFIWLVVLLS